MQVQVQVRQPKPGQMDGPWRSPAPVAASEGLHKCPRSQSCKGSWRLGPKADKRTTPERHERM